MSISAIPSSTFNPAPLGIAHTSTQRDWAQLGQDLKSGNLASAQQDFATLQQQMQAQGNSQNHISHNNYRTATQSNQDTANQASPLSEWRQLGKSLASADIAGAQQAYSALQGQSTALQSAKNQAPEPPLRRPLSIIVHG